MVRDPSREEDPPSVDDVLDALADDAARRIVTALTEPKTASDLSEECDIPLSTTYRKLEKLTDASLLRESTDIRRDGQHTTRYSVSFDSVTVSIDHADDEADESRDLTVEFSRPERTRDERLADLWSELREET
ncbi:transcriptional regulator [Halorubrum sp. Ib24]|uniref:winged helix-turn-helix domain-containing protein n=1 Tax=unclassified Halorubrum TaxID=2642239 RepID=UPI000B99CDCC|nr:MULTISPECIES: helix-turn-helix domain-containing protein [unclassified Halorubrum]OYR37949.1 transcriptional regulator [Halorubrum sp. Ib24]OYR39169.1 transcriptional regulator [Halorubrum sp. Eb13]OYR46434.1 transcriptional regulator [Halorubrum sp. Hd13]OYR47884.1 transcriptional regulator [Halorubrum sp. Ea8]OYR53087.1 transcriptional regulator [Halorubrum sp. Ea1]